MHVKEAGDEARVAAAEEESGARDKTSDRISTAAAARQGARTTARVKAAAAQFEAARAELKNSSRSSSCCKGKGLDLQQEQEIRISGN